MVHRTSEIMNRLRSVALIAAVWSAAWTIVGAGLSWVVPAVTGTRSLLMAPGGLPIWTLAGAAAGMAFAALLGTAERGGASGRLRFGRAAGWGAIAGAAVPFFIALPLIGVGVQPWAVARFWALVGGSAVIGAVTGAGIHAVVTRAGRVKPQSAAAAG